MASPRRLEGCSDWSREASAAVSHCASLEWQRGTDEEGMLLYAKSFQLVEFSQDYHQTFLRESSRPAANIKCMSSYVVCSVASVRNGAKLELTSSTTHRIP
jgi:hypothetical protein